MSLERGPRLEEALAAPPPGELADAAGLPAPPHAARMLGALRETLWA